MSFERNLDRIAEALESLASSNRMMLRLALNGPVSEEELEAAPTSEVEKPTLVKATEPETEASDQAPSGWDPLTEGLQDRYRDKDKIEAIERACEEHGVEVAKSWSTKKKHEALLEAVAAQGAEPAAAPEPAPDGADPFADEADPFADEAPSKEYTYEEAKAAGVQLIGKLGSDAGKKRVWEILEAIGCKDMKLPDIGKDKFGDFVAAVEKEL